MKKNSIMNVPFAWELAIKDKSIDKLGKWNHVNYSKENIYTNIIRSKLSVNDLLSGVRVFRIILEIEKEYKSRLKPLNDKELINAAARLLAIPAELEKLICSSPIMKFRRLRALKPEPKLNPKGREPDFPIVFLYRYYLNLLRHEGLNIEKGLAVIEGFANEQNFNNKIRNFTTIYKQIYRYSDSKLIELYNFFRKWFLRSINTSCSLENIDINECIINRNRQFTIGCDNYETSRDFLFPTWETMFPDKLDYNKQKSIRDFIQNNKDINEVYDEIGFGGRVARKEFNIMANTP